MTLFSWPELHGAVTHFPVALLLTSFAFDAAAAVTHRDDWRKTSFWTLVAGVVMAVPSIFAGYMTARQLFGGAAVPPPIFRHHMTAAISTAALATFLLIWRVFHKDGLRNGARTFSLALSLLVAGGISYTGYLGGHMVLGDGPQAPSENIKEVPQKSAGRPPKADPVLAAAGEKLFHSPKVGCTNCHRMNGQGGAVGPDLSHEGRDHPDITWQIAHLQDPGKVHPGSTMPSFAKLPPDQKHAIATYLVSRQ